MGQPEVIDERYIVKEGTTIVWDRLKRRTQCVGTSFHAANETCRALNSYERRIREWQKSTPSERTAELIRQLKNISPKDWDKHIRPIFE